MLRGEKGHSRVTGLACGAIAVRNYAPLAHELISATALLRSPCAQRQYSVASNFVGDRGQVIERIARVLANEGKMSGSQALWLIDQPAPRLAS
jgi:hypothetical protein